MGVAWEDTMQADNNLFDAQPLVTVIITSYNHARYIAQAIESVIFQSYKNLEIIVIDDGSKDHSLEIVNALADKYRFIVIARDNRGVAKTLNEGVELANGKYITFLASDDFYLPQRIENAVLQFEKSADNTAAVYCDGYIVNDDGKRIGLFGEKYARPLVGNIYDNLLVGNWIPALGVTYRANILRKFMFDERFKIEDYALYLRMFKNNRHELVFYNDFDFSYRWHASNFSKLTEIMKNENILIQNNFADVGRFANFKQHLKTRTFICEEISQWKNYYLLYLQIIRSLQNRSRSYHRNIFGLFFFYMSLLTTKTNERIRGFRYFGFAGFRKGIRVAGRIHIRGRKSNFHFGKNCRVLGDFYLVLEKTWKVKPSIIVGDNVVIDHDVYMNSHGGSITVGSNCHLGVGSVLQGKGGLVIGNGVLFGPNTRIFASNHNFRNIGCAIMQAGEAFTGVRIGDNIWVGAGCTIVDGAKLGDGSVYGAGGVVAGNYKKGTFNIAKQIRVAEMICSVHSATSTCADEPSAM